MSRFQAIGIQGKAGALSQKGLGVQTFLQIIIFDF